MLFTREEYLDICQTCEKKAFNIKKGIVCSLTDEHANYESDNCPEYVLDEVARDKKIIADKLKAESDASEATMGLSKFGIKSPTAAGAIVTALSLTWFFVGVISYDVIFFYPIILAAVGIFMLVKGIISDVKKVNSLKRKDTNILDDNYR